MVKSKVFDFLEALNKFGNKSETRIYGGDLPEKITEIGGKVVVPESKDKLEDVAKVFVKDHKGPGTNLGRIGEIFDRNFDEMELNLASMVGGPGDILQNLKELNKELFEEARRGTKTLQEMAEDAGKLGFDTISKNLMTRNPGDMLKPEEVLGGFLLLQKLNQEIAYGARKMTQLQGAEFIASKEMLEDYAKIQRLIEMSKTVSAQLSGGVSEFGRGLGLVSKLEQVLDVDFRMIDEKFDNIAQTQIDQIIGQNEKNVIRYELEALSALDFRQRQEYTTGVPIKKSIDVMMEMYINALLSSPVTHTVNVAGNGTFQVSRFLETGLSGVIGNIRQGVRGGLGMKVKPEDQAMLVEAHAFMHGSLMAQKDAFTLMLKTAITGESGDVTAKMGKIDLDRLGIGNTNNVVDVMDQVSRGEFGSAFINTMGIATRLPGRFLAMEDEYFKVMIKRRVQYQEAYRASSIEVQKRIKAGFSVDEAQQYGTAKYHEVLTNPSKDIREKMTQVALKETFQAPTGDRFASLFSHPAVKFLGVPFYRTPTNIFKEIGDRTINIYPTAKALALGQGREFDEALAKLVTGWGIMTTMTALVGGYYGDDIIVTGTGPGNQRARDIINKGANIPPASIGVKQDDGSYKFTSFNRFDPLSMLLLATADYVNFAEYNTDADALEKMTNVLMLATTEYAQTIPFLQGVAEFQNIVGDRFASGETRGARILKWLGTRTAGVASNIGGQAETFTTLGGGSLMRNLGVDYPFIGANSFMATMERISDPYKSNTMLAPDQISGIRVEDINPFWRGFYETLNRYRARHPLFAKDLPDDVNFWGEPVMQLDPDQLKKYGQFGMSFNPMRIQTGQYSDLDRELLRLSVGGAGTFSLHNRTQGGYKLLNDEYLRYVQMVNNIDDNGNMPEDDGYDPSENFISKLNLYIDPSTPEGDEYFLAESDEEKYDLLSDELSNKRTLARDKLFKTNNRLLTLKEIDETIQ